MRSPATLLPLVLLALVLSPTGCTTVYVTAGPAPLAADGQPTQTYCTTSPSLIRRIVDRLVR